MVSEGLCGPVELSWAGVAGGLLWSPSLTVLLSLLQAKFLSQDQIINQFVTSGRYYCK